MHECREPTKLWGLQVHAIQQQQIHINLLGQKVNVGRQGGHGAVLGGLHIICIIDCWIIKARDK